jgi:hypothetical protein
MILKVACLCKSIQPRSFPFPHYLIYAFFLELISVTLQQQLQWYEGSEGGYV